MPPSDLNVIYDPNAVNARMMSKDSARDINWFSIAIIALWCLQAVGGIFIVAFGLAGRNAWSGTDPNAVAHDTQVFYGLMMFGVALASVGGFGTLVFCTLLGVRLLALKRDGYQSYESRFRLVMYLAFAGLLLTYLGLAAAIIGRKRALDATSPAEVAKEVKLAATVAALDAHGVKKQEGQKRVNAPMIVRSGPPVHYAPPPMVLVRAPAPVRQNMGYKVLPPVSGPTQSSPRGTVMVLPPAQRNSGMQRINPAARALPPARRPAANQPLAVQYRALPPARARAAA